FPGGGLEYNPVKCPGPPLHAPRAPKVSRPVPPYPGPGHPERCRRVLQTEAVHWRTLRGDKVGRTPVDTFTPSKTGSPSRVLIVEDNRDSRESLRWLLELWGHEVEVAEDGQRGVAKALHWKPDTAVVDIGLPLLDGYQVARQVRAALHD